MKPNPHYLVETDYRLSLSVNQLSTRPPIHRLFALVSRLGDGVIWYAIVFSLPVVYGQPGGQVSIRLALASIFGVLVYKLIKLNFKRLRPFKKHAEIKAAAIALDEFSFPSGHTLHATSFAIILYQFLPVLALLFIPFAILTALSRVILGLHYVSDVIAGALVGAVLAKLILTLTATIF